MRAARRRKRLIIGCGIGWLLILACAYSAQLWNRYMEGIDRQIAQGPFSSSSNLYAAPTTLARDMEMSPQELAAELERSGYSQRGGNRLGTYRLSAHSVDILPGPQSQVSQGPVRVICKGDKIADLIALRDQSKLERYTLEPELITNVVNSSREKRRMVRFSEIPPNLVHAVLSVEDKRFFQHPGFDPVRIAKAAYLDWKEGRKGQGASTLTMQLARNLWLDPKKTWRRKLQELMISLRLEQKWSKEQIFEAYCNQIYLGRRDTFNIHGFGEGARIYFGKEVPELSLPEAATLAGIVQRPSYFNPLRYPDRTKDRRDIVLLLMKQNGYISQAEYNAATAEPVKPAPERPPSADAPYFLALANEELNARLNEENTEREMFRVHTTLDRNLQQAAEEAVRIGMAKVDKLLVRLHKNDETPAQAQVALVALDPHTGEIKAVVGGRDYRSSQLNHAISKRQPGSVFKPFVYAAALRAGVDQKGKAVTPYSGVLDEPTMFRFENQQYQPSNFHGGFHGWVTLRDALAHSMNIPAVKTAEMVGYNRVVELAHEAGMNEKILATPAVALGAYEATPIEVAGAYTIFVNEGQYVRPTFITRIEGEHGEVPYQHQPHPRRVLPPQTYFDMLDMLQQVVMRGTASQVNNYIKAPVAAKTGTSRDGWFAGFVSDLICVVWVGYDDNRELGLEGAKSALPIWGEFMKRALAKGVPAKQFKVPESYRRYAPPPKEEVDEPYRAADLDDAESPGLPSGPIPRPAATTSVSHPPTF